jgi:hypothetical protein
VENTRFLIGMFLAVQDVELSWSPTMVTLVVANLFQCVAIVALMVQLFRHNRETRRQLEALQTLVLRGMSPERLIKLASTLDRLSESDLDDLLREQREGETVLRNVLFIYWFELASGCRCLVCNKPHLSASARLTT